MSAGQNWLAEQHERDFGNPWQRAWREEWERDPIWEPSCFPHIADTPDDEQFVMLSAKLEVGARVRLSGTPEQVRRAAERLSGTLTEGAA